MDSGYETVTEDDSELSKILLRTSMPKWITGYLRFGSEKVVLPEYYLEFKDAIDNFEVRQDDVWVISYPKAGTTWTQEMVWCIANDLDFIGAKQKISERFGFLELSPLFDYRSFPEQQIGEKRIGYSIDSVTFTKQLKSPRFIKTHLPWQMLPKQLKENAHKTKIIYVARNAKDACLSGYHQNITLKTFTGDFETYAKLYVGETTVYAPFWSHVLNFWNRRQEENVLFLTYENMKRDLPSVIRQTAAFLGKTLTESQVRILADHLSFASMKDNPAVNYEENRKPGATRFMRKGEVDQWKADMSPELIELFDKWTSEHTKGSGLTF